MADIKAVLNKLNNIKGSGSLQFPAGHYETGDNRYMAFRVNDRSKLLSAETFKSANERGSVQLGGSVDAAIQGNIVDGALGVITAARDYLRDAGEAVLDKAFGNQPLSTPTSTVIYLPIPQALIDQYDYQFAQDELGTAAGYIAAKAAGSSLAAAVAGAAPDLARVGIHNALTQIGRFTSATDGAIARTTVGALNPYLRNNFQGVGFKTHQFRFHLAARNARDSKTIAEIIRTFRRASAPSGVNEPIFDVKHTFSIQFSQNVREQLYKFQESYLQSMQVMYNTMGHSAFHDDGAPVDVELVLVFVELPVYSQEADNLLYGEQGFGSDPTGSLVDQFGN